MGRRLQPDTSMVPLPMKYASMGYSSMGFVSMGYTSIDLLNFLILIELLYEINENASIHKVKM
jgi:hypothetical protein